MQDIIVLYSTAAQNKPATYTRLDTEDRELQPVPIGEEAKPSQPVQQPPPYIGYVPTQQAASRVSYLVV